MPESAALLVDEVLPKQPIRQWVLSFPFKLRFLSTSRPKLMGRVLGIVYRAVSSHLIKNTPTVNLPHQPLKLGHSRFGQSSLMNLSSPAGGGLLREDSGGDFFEWWCGELVKGALRSEVQ